MVRSSRTSEPKRSEISKGPANCGTRGRAEDAAEAVREMASTIRQFDHDLVKRLVIARNAATSIQAAFPQGDERFVDSDDDFDEGNENENDATEELESDDDSGEQCQGLLDTTMDSGPLQCLRRAKEDYGFDLVTEMDAVELDFFERIRVANFIRREVRDGQDASDVVRKVRDLLLSKHDTVLKDDVLLEPVIEGDLLLTVLESEEQTEAEQNRDENDVNDAVESSLRAESVLL